MPALLASRGLPVPSEREMSRMQVAILNEISRRRSVYDGKLGRRHCPGRMEADPVRVQVSRSCAGG